MSIVPDEHILVSPDLRETELGPMEQVPHTPLGQT